MAQGDLGNQVQRFGVVDRDIVPVAAAVDLLAFGVNERREIGIGQGYFFLNVACFGINLPQIIVCKIRLVRMPRERTSDHIVTLDKGLEFNNFQFRVFLGEVKRADAQRHLIGNGILGKRTKRDKMATFLIGSAKR